MTGRAELQVSLQQLEQLSPEQACEDFIMITNNTHWNACNFTILSMNTCAIEAAEYGCLIGKK
jgi:hypothetical protein